MAIMIDGQVVDKTYEELLGIPSTQSTTIDVNNNLIYKNAAEEAAEEAVEQANIATSAVSYIELLFSNFTTKYNELSVQLASLSGLANTAQSQIDDAKQSSTDAKKASNEAKVAANNLKNYVDTKEAEFNVTLNSIETALKTANNTLQQINYSYDNLVATYSATSGEIEQYSTLMDEVNTKHYEINEWYDSLKALKTDLYNAANKAEKALEDSTEIYNNINRVIHDVAAIEVQKIVQMAMISGGVACGEQVWKVPAPIEAGTIIVIPNGLSYIVGRHHLRISYDGVVIPIGGFEEVGAEGEYSNRFKTNIPLTKGQEIDAFVHHLAKDESKQALRLNHRNEISNTTNYAEFELEQPQKAGTVLRLPDGFEYIAGRHQFYICLNGLKLAPGQYYEVGEFNTASKYFVINIDVPVGSKFYAWTHHLYPQRMSEVTQHKHGNVFVHINGYEPEMPYIAYKFGASSADNIPIFTDASGHLLKQHINPDGIITFTRYTDTQLKSLNIISAASGMMFVTVPGVGATCVEVPLDDTAGVNYPFIIETEEAWVVDHDIPANSLLTLPNGMLYAVDRCNLHMALDGRIMSCATRGEIGVEGGLSNQIVTRIDIKAGQLLNAWTRHPICAETSSPAVHTSIGSVYSNVDGKEELVYTTSLSHYKVTGYEHSYPLCTKYNELPKLEHVYSGNDTAYVKIDGREYFVYMNDINHYTGITDCFVNLIPVYKDETMVFSDVNDLAEVVYKLDEYAPDRKPTCPINAMHFGLSPVYDKNGLAYVDIPNSDTHVYNEQGSCNHTPICLQAANQVIPILTKNGNPVYVTVNGNKYQLYTKGMSAILKKYVEFSDYSIHWNYDNTFSNTNGLITMPIYYIVGAKHLHLSIDGLVLYPSMYEEVGKAGEVSNQIQLLDKNIDVVTHWYAYTHHVDPEDVKLHYMH